jgi:hypothetical protein
VNLESLVSRLSQQQRKDVASALVMQVKLKSNRRLNADDGHSWNTVAAGLPDVLEIGSDGQEAAVSPPVV